jgi:RNA polymerase sigma factor (sigma-70 family)
LRKIIHLNDSFEENPSLEIFLDSGLTNHREVDKARYMLDNAIETMLTEKQKRCVKMHYYQEKSMRDIAKELGVNPSTVTRTIQSAKKRLSLLSYFLSA